MYNNSSSVDLKPVPGTIINIVDKSQITEKEPVFRGGPVFLAAAACDKGTEELTRYSSLSEFRNAHLESGVVNFNKYGLPLYQVDELLESGSEVIFKRIVSEDAKLANIGVIAVINKIEEQKKNPDGQLLYIGPDGEETTDATTVIPNPNYKQLTANTNIKGTTSSEMNSTVTVTVKDDQFTGVSNEVITSWFSAPDGTDISKLTFTVTSSNTTTITFKVSGTPDADIETNILMTIPSAKVQSGKELSLEINVSVNPSGGNSVNRKRKKEEVDTDSPTLTIQNTPAVITKAGIQFGAKYVKDCKNIGDVEHGFDTIYQGPEKIDYENQDDDEEDISRVSLGSLPDAELPNSNMDEEFPDLIINEDSYVIPLFIITEKGRGLSNRRIRIVPNYRDSKHKTYFMYRLEILEGGRIIHTSNFAFDPDYTENGYNRNIEVQNQNNKIVDIKVIDKYYNEFFKIIEDFTGLSRHSINSSIAITEGKDKNGKLLPNILVSGVNLQHTFGIRLSGGDYGKFGNNNSDVTKSKEYNQLLKDFYNGDLDDKIWDRDEIHFNLILDANHNNEIKKAIQYLCKTREDVSCMLDMTTNITSLMDFIGEVGRYTKHFTSNLYYQFGQVYNKFDHKKILMTLPTLIGKRLKTHFESGRSNPMCGKTFGFSFPEFIQNTIVHIPKLTPKVDEKTILKDNCINYGSIISNVFTLETNYTLQEGYTQLSFSSNVLPIQHLMQDIRKSSPEIRYRSLSSDDLVLQKDKYNSICNRHAGNFSICRFDYMGDENAELLKTFKGQVTIVCKNFTMKEEFDIFVVHADDSDKFLVSSNSF